uniref:Uncharacterized protein n=1 Tax=Physcomitrium patens TaxID=3218 RepID=A0A2K1JRU3_PHYPA|nr:hypothetical protein PHYPA_016634 [Physcomitrium patens]
MFSTKWDITNTLEKKVQIEELERIYKNELEKFEELRYKESLDHKLILNCINEILERNINLYLNPQP